jgi:hypothetical protein
MKKLRSLALLASAALVSLLAVPAGAAPTSITQDTFKGTAAVAQWFGGAEELGHPSAFYIMGADGIARSHVTGGKPVRSSPTIGGAMAIWLQDEAGEPYRAEVWFLPDEWSFSINDTLTAATLSFDCDGLIFTSEEGPPTGTLPVSVTATWTGVGPLRTEKSHSTYTDETGWSMDRSNSTVRQATAEVRITGPGDVVYFSGTVDAESGMGGEVDMFTTARGHIYRATATM